MGVAIYERDLWCLFLYDTIKGVRFCIKGVRMVYVDMGGSNDWEEAEIRMAMDLVLDTVAALIKFMFCKDEAEKVSWCLNG